LAAERGRKEIVDLLASKGAKRPTEATGGRDEKATTIVSRDALTGVSGAVPWRTPLHQAVEKGDIEAIKSLLAQSADINVKGWNSETPLGTAVYRREKEIVALLLSHGADVNSAYTGSGLIGTIPLHLALRSRQPEIAEMLILAGSDVNAQGGYERIAPLHLALDNRTLLELMLRHGGRIDLPSGDGMTCLHRAGVQGDDDLAGYLLDKGASVNLQDNRGNTPLHWAAKGGHGKVCRVLLDHEAGIGIKNNKGLLPLHYAQASGLDDIVVDLTPKTR
jgi:ankyrin repeat protein